MDYLTVLGLSAATLTTISFLPQMVKTWQTKSAKDVSYIMLITFILGVSLWLLYGIFRQDIAIILANAITLVFNLTILWLKNSLVWHNALHRRGLKMLNSVRVFDILEQKVDFLELSYLLLLPHFLLNLQKERNLKQ